MWKDGTSSWHSLADVKNSYPLQLANYAIKNGLEKEAAFHGGSSPRSSIKGLLLKLLNVVLQREHISSESEYHKL